MAISIEREMNELIKRMQKEMDNNCDVHYHLSPDGKCSCEEQGNNVIAIAAKIINCVSKKLA